jgi:hypothetical protein
MLAVNLGSPEYTLDVAKRCMEKGLIVFWQLYRNEYLRISAYHFKGRNRRRMQSYS